MRKLTVAFASRILLDKYKYLYHLRRIFAAKLPIARGMLGTEFKERKVGILMALC